MSPFSLNHKAPSQADLWSGEDVPEPVANETWKAESGRRADAERRYMAISVAMMFALPMMVLSYRLTLVTCLVITALLTPEIRAGIRQLPEIVRRSKLLICLMVWLGFGLVSLLWCVDRGLLIDKWCGAAGILTLALLLMAAVRNVPAAAADRMYRSFALGTLFGVLVLGVLAFDPGVLYQMIGIGKRPDRITASLAVKPLNLYSVLIWMAVPYWVRQWGLWRAMAPVLILIAALQIYDANGARLAMYLGLFLWATYSLLPWRLARVTLVGGCLFMLVFPPLWVASLPIEREGRWVPGNAEFPLALNESNQQRIMIWDFGVRTVRSAPGSGYGFGNARVVPGADQKLGGQYNNLTLHPHNGVLQAGMELGLPGMLLASVAAILLGWATSRDWADPVWRCGRPQAIASVILLFAVTYGLWQSWLMAAFALCLVADHLDRRSRGTLPTIADSLQPIDQAASRPQFDQGVAVQDQQAAA